MDRRFGARPRRQLRRDRPAGRKGRAAHPAVGTARLRLTPDRVVTARRHRACRSTPHKARTRAALLLGGAGAASRNFGAVPRLIPAHRRQCPLHPLFRQRREVHRSCYAAEVPGVDIKSRANSTPTAAQRFRCSLDYISLLSRKNSLLWLQKFPFPLRREFGCKPLNWLVDWSSKSERRARDSAKFPVNFPVSREFGAETSSQLTASSATQSGLCGLSISIV